MLFAAKASNWTSSDRIREHMAAYATEGWIERGRDRRDRLMRLRYARFMVESDIYTPQVLESDPTYQNFLRPRGLGWTVSTAMSLPTGDDLFICLNRDFDRGPVEPVFGRRLDELRPHLARGALMSARSSWSAPASPARRSRSLVCPRSSLGRKDGFSPPII